MKKLVTLITAIMLSACVSLTPEPINPAGWLEWAGRNSNNARLLSGEKRATNDIATWSARHLANKERFVPAPRDRWDMPFNRHGTLYGDCNSWALLMIAEAIQFSDYKPENVALLITRVNGELHTVAALKHERGWYISDHHQPTVLHLKDYPHPVLAVMKNGRWSKL